jgi:hypothetical protein
VHRKNILIYIQRDAALHSLFYLETALHVSSGTTTHHQERKQLYLQHLVFVTPLLLPAAIVEELATEMLLSLARRALKDKFPTPTVPLKTVLQNRQVFLAGPCIIRILRGNLMFPPALTQSKFRSLKTV